MHKYLSRVAALLSAGLLIFALIILQDGRFEI
jgi:hypothetical protein